MVKIEVKPSNPTDIYKTSGERGRDFRFESKRENGKWQKYDSDGWPEWEICIEENLPCLKGLADKQETKSTAETNAHLAFPELLNELTNFSGELVFILV